VAVSGTHFSSYYCCHFLAVGQLFPQDRSDFDSCSEPAVYLQPRRTWAPVLAIRIVASAAAVPLSVGRLTTTTKEVVDSPALGIVVVSLPFLRALLLAVVWALRALLLVLCLADAAALEAI